MVINRRQYLRSPSYIIAKYIVLKGKFRNVIKNIGAGGLFIRTSRKIAIGQPIWIEFPLSQFDNPIQVTGRVVRVDSTRFAVTFTKPIYGLISKDGELPMIVHETDRS